MELLPNVHTYTAHSLLSMYEGKLHTNACKVKFVEIRWLFQVPDSF